MRINHGLLSADEACRRASVIFVSHHPVTRVSVLSVSDFHQCVCVKPRMSVDVHIGQKLTFLMRNISAYFLRSLSIPTVHLLPVVTEHNQVFLKSGGEMRRMCCPVDDDHFSKCYLGYLRMLFLLRKMSMDSG